MFKNILKNIKFHRKNPAYYGYGARGWFSSDQAFKNFTMKDMSKTFYKKLKESSNEYARLTEILMKENQTVPPQELEKNRIRTEELLAQHEAFLEYDALLKGLDDLHKMKIDAKDDRETLEFAEEEIEIYQEKMTEIEDRITELLIPVEEYDDCDAIKLEIRAAAGGSESALFADDVFKMYQGYCRIKGWSSATVLYSKDSQTSRGCKNGILKITGSQAYKYLKCEAGVHKVIRVPETEKSGRLHSSTISVVVLPEVPMNFKVDDKDIKLEFMRSSGAGGQHVNKTESACSVRATHVPTGISVHIQDEREQKVNKAKALQILRDKLFANEFFKKQDEVNSSRKEQIASGERSDKIRTYNFPQSRITDHRTNLTHFGIEKMLTGELLDQFIEEYLKKLYTEKLQEILKSEK